MTTSTLRTLVVLLGLVVVAISAEAPSQFTVTKTCSASSSTACFITFFDNTIQNFTLTDNIVNFSDKTVSPPSLTASASSDYTIQACFTNALLPVNNLADSCLYGSYGTVKAATASNKRSVTSVEGSKTSSASLFLPVNLPTDVISYTTSSSSSVDYSLTLTGYTCPANTFYYNGTCNDLVQLTQQAPQIFSLEEDEYRYFYFTLTGAVNTLQFTLKTDEDTTISHNSLELEVSNVFLPDGVYQTDAIVTDSRNYRNRTVYAYGPGTWYIGVKNTDSKSHNATLAVVLQNCHDASLFGQNCALSYANVTHLVPTANYSADPASFTINDDGDTVYFQLDLEDPVAGTFVRVSVAGEDNQPAPALYALPNAAPSSSFFAVNATTGGNVNQALLTVVPTATWYLGVVGQPGQVFYIWAGANCASNCSSDGVCNCNNGTCDDTIYNPVPINPFVTDSYGQCVCKSDDYISFNCGIDINTFKTIYIVLIAIGGAIVLAVAIGVPIYCYLQNKSPRYQRL